MWRASDGPEGKAAVPRFPRAAVGRGRATTPSTWPHASAPGNTRVEDAGGSVRPGPAPGTPVGSHSHIPRHTHPRAGTGTQPYSHQSGTTKPPYHSGTKAPPDGHHSGDKAAPRRTPPGHNKAARPQWGRAAVAVALGFEPRVAVTPHSISSAAPSAARTRYLTRVLYYRNPRATQIDPPWEQRHTQRGPRSRRS